MFGVPCNGVKELGTLVTVPPRLNSRLLIAALLGINDTKDEG